MGKSSYKKKMVVYQIRYQKEFTFFGYIWFTFPKQYKSRLWCHKKCQELLRITQRSVLIDTYKKSKLLSSELYEN